MPPVSAFSRGSTVVRESARQARWKFLLVATAISLVVRIGNFVNRKELATPEVIGSFVGAAVGGLILGWVGWWAWSSFKNSDCLVAQTSPIRTAAWCALLAAGRALTISTFWAIGIASCVLRLADSKRPPEIVLLFPQVIETGQQPEMLATTLERLSENFLKRIQTLIVCASMALLTACGTSAVLQAGAVAPAADETVVVVGIKPAHYKVLFFAGSEEQGRFVKSSWSNAVINGTPTDGYLVAKVKPEQLIGLTMIADTRAGAFAKPYAPCNGAKALVLKVPQASVVYLGDIEYTPSGAQIGVQYRDDIAAATRYLRTHYPNVTGEVRRAETRALPVSSACISPAIYVPIYILGGRR